MKRDFAGQINQIRSYYQIYGKFHVTDLPSTTYDINSEETNEIGATERMIIQLLDEDYHPLLKQDKPLPREYPIDDLSLNKILAECLVKKRESNWLKLQKELKPSNKFDFNAVRNESGLQTLQRVQEFINHKPDKVRKLKSGHVYHGQHNYYGFMATIDEDIALLYGGAAQKGDVVNSAVVMVYLGQLEGGCASGFGTLVFDRGTGRYQGTWKNGLYEGSGKYTYEVTNLTEFVNLSNESLAAQGGDKKPKTVEDFDEGTEVAGVYSYEGNWSRGEMHGDGIFTWPNGFCYQGPWFRGRRHGNGKILNREGFSIQTGKWVNGRYVS